MDETKLKIAKLTRFDHFMLRLLRVGELNVHEYPKGNFGVGSVAKLYWNELRNFPIAITISILGVSIGSVTAILTPYIFKQFLDLLNSAPMGIPLSQPLWYIFLLVSVNIVGWLFWRASFITMAYIASNMLAKLRQGAFSYLIDHSHRFFSSSFTGSLVQRVNRFSGSYDRLADRIVFDIIPIIIQVTGILIVLAREQHIIAYIVIVWVVLFTAWNYGFARWKLRFDIGRAAQDSRTTAQLADSITNQQTIELYRSQNHERDLYRSATELQSRFSRFSWQSSSIIDGIQALFIITIEAIVLYTGVAFWKNGTFTIGTFVLVQSYIMMLTDRLWSFSRIIRDIYESFADAKEMAEIMFLPHEIQEKADADELINVEGEIEFRNVSFSFHGKPIVDKFDLRVSKGEKIALVGVSGAGKSTIVKLLFRQYDPGSGEILIDNKNIADLTLKSLRDVLSLVPQDPALFHRTLMENIRYGKQQATDEEVIAAARLAHCDEFIEKLSTKYDTLVGERGIRLSGGERQRVAIARAFLRNSPILVLDEATSSLDSQSEERIQDALMRLMEGKTTIIIAHRLSTIRRMDRIIVLENGGIIEDGTHDALIKKGGRYATLWNIQQGGFLRDEPGEQESESEDNQ